MADRRAKSRFDWYGPGEAVWGWGWVRALWRLHRKEPGWFVGEHMQDFFWCGRWTGWAEMDRFGEVENRMEGVEGESRLTRVGEEARSWWWWWWWGWEKVLEKAVAVEEAKAAEEEVVVVVVVVLSRPEGERERRTGPLECLVLVEELE
ncbi:hypothetical protein vseg_016468 [Gypsophila vaccaria]